MAEGDSRTSLSGSAIRELVKSLLEDGHTRRDVAERLGVSGSTVSRHAMHLGHLPTRRRAVRYDWAAVARMYEAGATARECQVRFGFSNGAWASAINRGAIRPRRALRRRGAGETRREVETLLRANMSVSQIARALGVSKPTVCYHARRLGQPADKRFRCRYDWHQIQLYHDAGHSTRECAAHFGFNLGSWFKAVQRGAIIPRPQAMPLEELLAPGVPRSRNHLKLRLFRLGLKEKRCEECGISEWRGRPLSLALHHVNGIKDDNRLENLSLLCANCHSQTENFSGRNSRRSLRQERLVTPASQG